VLLTHQRTDISEGINNLLVHIFDDNFNQWPHLSKSFERTRTSRSSADLIIKLFDTHSCQFSLIYSVCLKMFDFLHSLSFAFNRHTLAIFFGNALPSFLVFLANLLSIKIIVCSKRLLNVKQTSRKKRRLKNDLRAFLVILVESFSIITISWLVPILITMYHCKTLYVVSIAACPQIKHSLAIFLAVDLFNSSTNCLLYSLSGKLFRRKLIAMLKSIVTCNRGDNTRHRRSQPVRSCREHRIDSLVVASNQFHSKRSPLLLTCTRATSSASKEQARLSDVDDLLICSLKPDDNSLLVREQIRYSSQCPTCLHSCSIRTLFMNRLRTIHTNDSSHCMSCWQQRRYSYASLSMHNISPIDNQQRTMKNSTRSLTIAEQSQTRTKITLVENVTSV
jgi:hypothetical protein